MKQRLTNIELLRIVLMLMIVIGHANFLSLTPPVIVNVGSLFSLDAIRILLQSMVEVGVDGFILISGYFGIRASAKGLGKLIYQVLFYFFGIYLISVMLTRSSTAEELLFAFDLGRSEWFFKAYICLYIISPILNIYIEKANLRLQGLVLLSFYLYTFVYGWIGGASRFFLQGYTPFAFIGLYLLGSYIRQMKMSNAKCFFKKVYKTKPIFDLTLYFLVALMGTSIICLVFVLKPGVEVYWAVNSYVSPFIVGGALFLFLAFSKLNLQYKKFVNTLAKSSFAVYLFHSEVHVRFFFNMGMTWLFDFAPNSLAKFLSIIVYSLAVYLVVVIIDQIRIYSYNRIINYYDRL